ANHAKVVEDCLIERDAAAGNCFYFSDRQTVARALVCDATLIDDNRAAVLRLDDGDRLARQCLVGNCDLLEVNRAVGHIAGAGADRAGIVQKALIEGGNGAAPSNDGSARFIQRELLLEEYLTVGFSDDRSFVVNGDK